MTHQGSKTLESSRLILRKFAIEDADAMYNNWANDPEVTKYLSWPTHTSASVSQEVIASWLPQYDSDAYYHWAIVLKENNQPIGSTGAARQKDNIKMVEIGYCIGRKWWGQGITSEVLRLLMAFFFDEVKINRLAAEHDTRNPASGRVMEKCGLVREGTLRQGGFNNQGVGDNAVWSILAEEYLGLKK